MNATRSQLTKQFNSVKQYLPDIRIAAEEHGFSPSLLLAIGSRETNYAPRYKTQPGDRGHGFSWWQVDIRSYPDWIHSGAWKDPKSAVYKAAEVLDEKRQEISRLASLRTPLSSADLLRCAVAAYNCGSKAAYGNFVNHNDPDRGTTGKDYSADVLAREKVFRELEGTHPLPEPAPEPGAPEPEAPKIQPPPEAVTPETATTVTPSKPSLWGRIAAFGHWIIAGLTGVGITIDQLYDKIFGYASDHVVLLVSIIFIGVLVIVGAFLWDRAQQRAHERTLKIADIAADQHKNNVFIGGK